MDGVTPAIIGIGVLIIVIQYVIIIAWLLSPFSGITGEDFKRKPGVIFSSAALLLGLDFILFSGFYFFQELSDRYVIDSSATVLATIVLSPIIALIVGQYFAWVLVQDHSAFEDEIKSKELLHQSADFSFQEKRRKRLQKSSKRR